jgi:hypothetical protein
VPPESSRPHPPLLTLRYLLREVLHEQQVVSFRPILIEDKHNSVTRGAQLCHTWWAQSAVIYYKPNSMEHDESNRVVY